MPIITMVISNLDVEKKRSLAKGLTKVGSEVTGIPQDKFIVIIDEHSRENIASGGTLLADRK